MIPNQNPTDPPEPEQEPAAIPAEAMPPENPPEAPEVPEVLDTPEVTADPEREKREEAVRAIRAQAAQRKEMLEAGGDVGGFLAEWTEALDGDTAKAGQWGAAVLRYKGMDEETATKRVEEMIQLEASPFFHSLNEQLADAFPGQEPAAITRYAQEVRHAFHEVIAASHLTTADLERLVAGGIKIHNTDHGDSRHYDSVASVGIDQQKLALNLYRAFFARRQDSEQSHNDQPHLMRHELGHAISQQIFDDRLTAELEQTILTAVEDANADTSHIPPEFQAIVALLRDPQKASELEKRQEGHLHNRFVSLAQETDPQKLASFRRVMIREILAERVANYLASDGQFENYCALRARHEASPALFDPANEQALFDTISAGFENKDQWRTEYNKDEWDWFNDIDYELCEPEDTYLSATSSPTPSTGAKGASQGPLDKLVDFLIGTGEHKSA
jgi:hypothetical protein